MRLEAGGGSSRGALRALVISPHAVDLQRVEQILEASPGTAAFTCVSSVEEAMVRLCDDFFYCVVYVGESLAMADSIRYWMDTVLGDEAPPLTTLSPWRLGSLAHTEAGFDFCQDVCRNHLACQSHWEARASEG